MNEYISRKELIEHLDKCRNDQLFDPDMARICFAISVFVENMKVADVQPVKHGRWDYRGIGSPEFTFRCSCCENISPAEYSYCPNCGARMEGMKNE